MSKKNYIDAIVITTTGDCLRQKFLSDDSGSIYPHLKNAVGGWIEAVNIVDDSNSHVATMYVNEEGKLHGLPFNDIATTLYLVRSINRTVDIIVGDVVIVASEDENGYAKPDLPQLIIEEISHYSDPEWLNF